MERSSASSICWRSGRNSESIFEISVESILGKTAFVDRPGPHGMIIVLAGQKEREALMAESQTLVEEVEHQIGLK